MANTYTQIHLHIIFAVKNRESLIKKSWKDRLFRYMTGIVQENGHKMLQINGMPDHVHLLIGLRPTQSLSALMKGLKGKSSLWINREGLSKYHFSWQQGYGAFSCSKTHLPRVIRYIQNQDTHHRQKSFREEYIEFLEAFELDYDERFLFRAI